MHLAFDDVHGLCFLGDVEERPAQAWLDMQEVPFADDAVFNTAYPYSGGEVCIDLNKALIVGDVNDDTIKHAAKHLSPPVFDHVNEMYRCGFVHSILG